MKRWLTFVAILTVVGATRGQGPDDRGAVLKTGPIDQGAILKSPSLEVFNKPAYANPLYDAINPNAPQNPFPNQPSSTAAVPKFNQTDINKDIEVTSETGPWMVLVMTYSGENAPVQARKFVAEIRGHYKLNAHIFNYGAKEKREEYKRAIKEADLQRERLKKDNLIANVPLRLRVSHIPETTAVFIGGFVSRDEAERVLKEKIRKLDQPEPKKVDLDVRIMGTVEDLDKNTPTRNSPFSFAEPQQTKIKVGSGNAIYKNPFKSAIVVRNPCLPAGQSAISPEEELRYIRKINTGEPNSLLSCKGKYTLAVKEFKTPVIMQENQQEVKGFGAFGKGLLGPITGPKSSDIDFAASNARTVVEGFRKAGLTDTFVLHTRYSSYVTVGSYDSPADANMLRMQAHLENYFRHPDLRPLEMYPRPIPMEVPR